MTRGDQIDGFGPARGGAIVGHVDDWDELAVDYLDGRAHPDTKAAIERHLSACPECAARLGVQQSVVRFVHETLLDDPPADLEYRVLGEMLFPSQPLERPKVEESSRWSVLWRKRIRPWIPASVAVVALLAAVVGYGIARSAGDSATQVATDGGAVASAEQAPEPGTERTVAAVGAETTLAALDTTTAAGGEVTTTSAASQEPVPPATQDKKTMEKNLRAAQAPAYMVFEATALNTSDQETATAPSTTVSNSTTTTVRSAGDPGKTEEVVANIVAHTGMEPLGDDLSVGGPTFAAFVPRDDVNQLVELMQSIGSSLRLLVTLEMEPPAQAAATVEHLLQNVTDVPVLEARRLPQPAVSGWGFTTSTLDPTLLEIDPEEMELRDVAGTHVLVVFCLRL